MQVYTVQDLHCKNTKQPAFEEQPFSTKKTAISTKLPVVGSGSKTTDVLMAVEELERELPQEIVFLVD